MRSLQEQMEKVIEHYLEECNNYPDAEEVINRIKQL
jgi:predicted DNA-binding protein